VAEAEWLGPRLAAFGSAVASIVPGGFTAYVRILHPARGADRQALRWADVAARSGRILHRLSQFESIHRPGDFPAGIDPPEEGNLPADLLNVLCGVLAEHTGTPESCWFCLWNGYGWLHKGRATIVAFKTNSGSAASPQAVATTVDSVPLSPIAGAVKQMPLVSLPNRDYHLLEGRLDAATELGWYLPGGHFVPQSPNLVWPQDHAWCVASEIDLVSILVAGSDALAERLVADLRVEAFRVFADDPVSRDSDPACL
jgi:hypothetical protein